MTMTQVVLRQGRGRVEESQEAGSVNLAESGDIGKCFSGEMELS